LLPGNTLFAFALRQWLARIAKNGFDLDGQSATRRRDFV
jgi:hypothetical protein